MPKAGTEKIARDWRQRLARLYSDLPNEKAPYYFTRLREELGPKAPGLNSIQKRLRGIKENYQKSISADQPFALDQLASGRLDIPPDAMPYVALAYQQARTGQSRLTLRQVQWVIRFYRIVKPEVLFNRAAAYSTLQRSNEIEGKSFDSQSLDESLFRDHLVETITKENP